MAKWTESDKLRALAIVEASTVREANKQTGIPLATIGRWMGAKKELSDGTEQTEQNGTNNMSKKIEAITQVAIDQATASVTEIITRKSEALADRILSMVQLAIEKSEQTLNEGPNKNEPRAGWLKATIGAMHMGVDKTQLLMGKPTQRQELNGEVTQKNEQTVTHIHTIEEYQHSFANILSRQDRLSGGTLTVHDTGQPIHSAETDSETS